MADARNVHANSYGLCKLYMCSKPAADLGGAILDTGTLALGMPGRRTQARRRITITLAEKDARRIDWFCRVLGVDYSGFFKILMAGTEELARAANKEDRS